DARVDQVLAWLDLPSEERPAFVSLYFEQADVAAHSYGPDSLQLNEALVTIDAALGHLVRGLRERHRYEATNLVILSDHGMSATSPGRVVLLDHIVNPQQIELVTSLVNVGIEPKPGYVNTVERALLAPNPHLRCWKKERMPKRFHYGVSGRIPSIQCVPDD